MNGGARLRSKDQRSKVKVTGNKNVKIVLEHVLAKIGSINRFTSNQDQNEQRPILQVSSNTFHQQKKLHFVIFVCRSFCYIPHISFVYSIFKRDGKSESLYGPH